MIWNQNCIPGYSTKAKEPNTDYWPTARLGRRDELVPFPKSLGMPQPRSGFELADFIFCADNHFITTHHISYINPGDSAMCHPYCPFNVLLHFPVNIYVVAFSGHFLHKFDPEKGKKIMK